MAAPTAELREFLDQWRLSQGWSIQRLADEIGVHQSLVSKWLHPDPRRRVVPGPRRLRRIAELTGVPYSQLRQYVDPEDVGDEGVPRPSDPELAAVTAALQAAWPHWDEGFRRAVRTLLSGGGAHLTTGYASV